MDMFCFRSSRVYVCLSKRSSTSGTRVPRSHWKDVQNQRDFLDSLAEQVEYHEVSSHNRQESTVWRGGTG